MTYKWNFLAVPNGPIRGPGDPGMETFKGNRYKSLAREVCQNSLDAAYSESSKVLLEFRIFDLPVAEFPDRENFMKALSLIQDFYRPCPDEKVTRFLNRADQILSSKSIRCLRISDCNTTGLPGSKRIRDFFTPWYSLVKSLGVGNRGTNKSGGFGIGKSAPFACSELRTVFYSTLDSEGICASQGVSRLVSFMNENGDIAIGDGHCCQHNLLPVYEASKLDKNFNRVSPPKRGTDIFVLGFNGEENWQDEMMKSVIDGFMLAIIEERLAIKIEKQLITKDNLYKYVAKYGDSMPQLKNYYEVLTAPNEEVFIDVGCPIENYDDLELRVLVKSEFHNHRKVACFRSSGMKIQDKGHISPMPFAGALILRGDKINKHFKDMESVAHDKWEYDRIEDIKEKRLAKANLSKLYKYIREQVRSLEANDNTEVVDAVGVGNILHDDINIDDIRTPKTIHEILPIRIKPLSTIEVVESTPKTAGIKGEYETSGLLVENDDGELWEEDGYKGGNVTQRGTGGGSSTGNGGVGRVKKRAVKIEAIHVRLFCSDFKSGEYTLIFTPSKSITNGYIGLYVSCEQGNVPATLIGAIIGDGSGQKLDCAENKIFISNIEEKAKTKVYISIDASEYRALEVLICDYQT